MNVRVHVTFTEAFKIYTTVTEMTEQLNKVKLNKNVKKRY